MSSPASSAPVAAWGCSARRRCCSEIDRSNFPSPLIIAWFWRGDSWDACFVGGGHCSLDGAWRIPRSFPRRSVPTTFPCPARLEAILDFFLSKLPCSLRPSLTSARKSESTAESAWPTHPSAYSSGLGSLTKRRVCCWWVYHSTFYSTCWGPE